MDKYLFAKLLASIPEAVERGHLISARLRSMGIQTNDIARELGVGGSAVSHAIADDGKRTRIQKHIAKLLGMDIAELFPRSHGKKVA